MSKKSSHRLTKDQVRELRERLIVGTESIADLAKYYQVTERAIRLRREQFNDVQHSKAMEPVIMERALQVGKVNSIILEVLEIQLKRYKELDAGITFQEGESSAEFLIKKMRIGNDMIEAMVLARNSVSLFPTVGGGESVMSPQEADALVSRMTPEERTKFLEERKRYEGK
ncbi:MAG: hypothetical protein Q8O19_03740 [Rectinemataceae bacterium]|nr:hypothetical protein [Rectinemataceae bacterium]